MYLYTTMIPLIPKHIHVFMRWSSRNYELYVWNIDFFPGISWHIKLWYAMPFVSYCFQLDKIFSIFKISLILMFFSINTNLYDFTQHKPHFAWSHHIFPLTSLHRLSHSQNEILYQNNVHTQQSRMIYCRLQCRSVHLSCKHDLWHRLHDAQLILKTSLLY